MNSKLTQFEIKDLIFRYNSELRKLEFQIYKTKETIQELHSELNNLSAPIEQIKRNSGLTNSPAETTIKSYQNLIKDVPEDQEADGPQKNQPRRFKPEFEFPGVKGDSSSENEIEQAPIKKRGRPAKSNSHVTKPANTYDPVSSSTSSSNKGYRLSEWDKFIIESLEEAKQVLINADFLSLAKIKNEQSRNRLSENVLKGKLTRSIHKLANKRGEIVKIDFSGKGYAYALKDWINPKGMLKRKYAN